jgi:hypothetical protein
VAICLLILYIGAAAFGAVSGPSVPFLMEVFPLLNVAQQWPDVWGLGLGGPPQSVDLTSEITAGAPGQGRWWASRGTSLYSIAANRQSPWDYIPYGGLVYNSLCQQGRAGAAPLIDFYFWPLDNKGEARPVLPADLPVQPEWFGPLCSARPGSIMTYDWTTNSSIEPTLGVAAMTADVFMLVDQPGEVALTRAGLVRSGFHAVGSEVATWRVMTTRGLAPTPMAGN